MLFLPVLLEVLGRGVRASARLIKAYKFRLKQYILPTLRHQQNPQTPKSWTPKWMVHVIPSKKGVVILPSRCKGRGVRASSAPRCNHTPEEWRPEFRPKMMNYTNLSTTAKSLDAKRNDTCHSFRQDWIETTLFSSQSFFSQPFLSLSDTSIWCMPF